MLENLLIGPLMAGFGGNGAGPFITFPLLLYTLRNLEKFIFFTKHL
jgi:hypothetical protein